MASRDIIKLGISITKMKKHNTEVNNLRRIITVPILSAMVCVLVFGIYVIPRVRADQFDYQINSLQTQNSQAQAVANNLQVQATSYQDTVDRLQAQITLVQQQIEDSQTKQVQLSDAIIASQAKLDQEKIVLGEDIKVMYVNSKMSTVEMLATSKDLSTFVDAETYRSAVQGKIQDELTQVAALQAQLKQQKQQVDALLKTQQVQQDQISADESQQSQLLAYSESQKAQYDQQIQTNNSQIVALRAEQAAAYAATFRGSSSSTDGTIVYNNLTSQQMCGGGYDFHCSDTQDNWFDNWGEYNRECVSYAAWMMNRAGHYVPDFGYYKGHARGNAYQWQGVLQDSGAANIIYGSEVVNSTASLVGDVVYMPIGGLGHVGVVLSDVGNGWVHVGQYNIYDKGMYSEMDLKVTPNLTFFHFTQ